ncbi:MAG: hypothetical protein ABFR36_10585 [Acidobacteriota bacterium]
MKRPFSAFLLFIFLLYGIVFPVVPVSKVKERIEKTGLLKFKSSVELKYVSGSFFKTYIRDYFDKTYPSEISEKESKFLHLMGFLKSEGSLTKLRKRVIENNAGGLYDERNGKLMIISDHMNSDPVYQLILVHELRHALQDQYYNISKLFGNLSDFDDRKLAVTAALEGDAMLLMTQYAEKYTPFPVSPELSLSGYNSDALLSFSPVKFSHNLDDLPPVIKYHLTMPYIHGLKFVFRVFKKGKWKSVNKILNSPPVSTEQILHPEKYLKGELPAGSEPVYAPEKYELYHSGTLGEYLLNILLMEKNNYKDVASGWGGDTFKLFRKENSYVLIWKSVWDKEEYCERFFKDFRLFKESASGISFRDGNVKGNPFIAGRNEGWYLFIRKFGKTMFFVKTNDRKEMNNFINGGYYD